MDHNDSLRIYFQYRVCFSEIEAFSRYCFGFVEILKFPGDRLELLPNVYNFNRKHAPAVVIRS